MSHCQDGCSEGHTYDLPGCLLADPSRERHLRVASSDEPCQLEQDRHLTFLEACREVTKHGYTPVDTAAYERLRAWLDKTNGWPPKEWKP